MKTDTMKFAARFVAIAIATSALGGCALFSSNRVANVTNERECLARAMYFESNRSSDEGMLAVGTVVMNRKESGKYPGSICGVVGQRVQFAPGVLTRQMADAGRPRAFRMADAVLAGKRYPGMKGVYFFHTAGYTYPYSNMHYVAVAGGNAFYEKRRSPGAPSMAAPTMVAQADLPPRVQARPVVQASYQPAPVAPLMAAPKVALANRSPAKAQRVQIAMNDDLPALPEAMPPERPRGSVGQARPVNKRGAKPQFDESPLPAVEELPPVRPRKRPMQVAATEPQVQFNFEQGPAGKAMPPARPRVASTQSRPVTTVRVQTVPVQADMGGSFPDEAPVPAPRKSSKPRSALEPQPLY